MSQSAKTRAPFAEVHPGPTPDSAVAGLRAADALLQDPLQHQAARRERIARWRTRGQRAFAALATIGVFASALHYGPSWGFAVPWNLVLGVVLGVLVGTFWPERRGG